MVIQAYAPTSNAEEAEVEWFYEDLRDLLELTPKRDVQRTGEALCTSGISVRVFWKTFKTDRLKMDFFFFFGVSSKRFCRF